MKPKMNRKEISINEFSPQVLQCFLFTQGANYPQGFRLGERYIYDYEIEYFLYSNGGMTIDGREYPIHKGDVVFRRPGQTTEGIMPYTCYMISFDLKGNSGKNLDTYEFTKEQNFQDYYLNPILDSIPPVFHVPYEEKYHALFDSVLKEYIHRNEGSELILKTYVLQILYHLYMDLKDPLLNGTIPSNPHYAAIKRVIAYIKDHIGEKILLEQLAGQANLSPSHFHKVFTGAMNLTPNEYITKLRLEKAKELLVKTGFSISEVALECGFENIPYFSYVFKKSLNMAPGEFRNRHSYI